MAEPASDSAVVLRLPEDPHYARVARSVAVACASLASFDMDDLVDVRLLVDEVFHALTMLGDGPITLTVRPEARALGVEMRVVGNGRTTWSHPDFALVRRVIDVICVTAAIGESDGESWFEARLQAMDMT